MSGSLTTPRLELLLPGTPCGRWTARQVIVLDWYDGPRRGLCALARPKCEFYFSLYTERLNQDGLDDRIFRISQLRTGSVDRILKALTVCGKPTKPLWIPIWKFPSEDQQSVAEQMVDKTVKAARATPLIVKTADMLLFEDCVNASIDVGKFLDWFEYIGRNNRHAVAGE